MNHIVAMQVGHSLKGLSKKLEGFCLCEDSFCVLVVKEVASLCVFHNHIDGVMFYKGVPEFDEVWVVQLSVELYFSFDEFGFCVCG